MKKIFFILGLNLICLKAHSFQLREDTIVYTIVETMPEYAEGKTAFVKYLMKNISIPEDADLFDLKVYISLIVEKDGSLTNIKVDNGGSKKYNNSIIKTIKSMSLWKPGINEGKIVRCQMRIPIIIHFSR